jgi:TIR domain/VHL beta domain
MTKIVISYRRRDSDAISGRIRDRMVAEYGPDSVFMDIDSIPIGVNFRKYISTALRATDILLAIIGPHWLGDEEPVARIQNPTDPVRIELEKAFELQIPVWPVLVNGAVMPEPVQLPETLQELPDCNAAFVDSGRDFHAHMDRLIRELNIYLRESGKITGRATQSKVSPGSLPRSSTGTGDGGLMPASRILSGKAIGVLSVALIAGAAFGGWLFFDKHYRPPAQTAKSAPVATNPIVEIGCKEEKNLRSLPTSDMTMISFANDSSSIKRIYWLNETGKRVLYNSLGPGQTTRIQTYMTHPWVVTDRSDECESIYMPVPYDQNIRITE